MTVMPSTETGRRRPADTAGVCPYAANSGPQGGAEPVFVTAGNGVGTWRLTRPADVRAVLADTDSFTSRRGPGNPPPGPAGREVLPTIAGMFVQGDGPDHLGYRRLLAREFSAIRAGTDASRVTTIADSLLDSMVRAGAPADLVGQYALPLASQALCAVLGLPWDVHGPLMLELFAGQDLANADLNSTTTPVDDYVSGLARGVLAEPAGHSGLLGRIAVQGLPHRPLAVSELAGIAKLLLMAGHVSPTHMLALSTLTLLQDRPAWYAKLATEPTCAPDVVEELLHHITIKQYGLTRRAVRDAEIGGVLIRAGQWVTCPLDTPTAELTAFTPGRRPVTHLAFGEGPHQCLGQHLSRTVLSCGLTTLAQRLPALRLAVPPDDLPWRSTHTVAGVTCLPVTW
ncbi:cytochrome P450 [Streptomyces sp. NPDC057686]|uniref:cytochrome P450 n=1 Tax=Streptomyces sp. NPDC057686 TaxID=3346212 RepID=UPI00367A8FE2